jgi:hypothetical protein
MLRALKHANDNGNTDNSNENDTSRPNTNTKHQNHGTHTPHNAILLPLPSKYYLIIRTTFSHKDSNSKQSIEPHVNLL